MSLSRAILSRWVLAGFIVLTGCPFLRAQDAADASSSKMDAEVSSDEQAAAADSSAESAAPDADSGQAAAAMSGDAPTDSAPTGVGAATLGGGILGFQTDLFTGRFTYRVPIVVPPARCNSQPSVALGYSSSGGNGWCGVGWMLDMGYIQRDTRWGVPRAWSGSVPANQYDDSAGFICSLGGVQSPLVFIQNQGADKEYRLETDNGSFLKFLWKSDGSWQVTDKGRNNFYFGTATASRMENTKFAGATVAQKTFRWALDRAEDPKGNKTVLTYTSNSNQLYLAQIQYNLSTKGTFTANTVDFGTISRSDTTVSFLAGYRVETRQLLKEIVVKAAGQNVRKYVLNLHISHAL